MACLYCGVGGHFARWEASPGIKMAKSLQKRRLRAACIQARDNVTSHYKHVGLKLGRRFCFSVSLKVRLLFG